MSEASQNGIHQPDGKFAAGNPGGPGNPHAGQLARLRSAMLEAVTPDDMRGVVLKLDELAKGESLLQQQPGRMQHPDKISAMRCTALRAELAKDPLSGGLE